MYLLDLIKPKRTNIDQPLSYPTHLLQIHLAKRNAVQVTVHGDLIIYNDLLNGD